MAALRAASCAGGRASGAREKEGEEGEEVSEDGEGDEEEGEETHRLSLCAQVVGGGAQDGHGGARDGEGAVEAFPAGGGGGAGSAWVLELARLGGGGKGGTDWYSSRGGSPRSLRACASARRRSSWLAFGTKS